MAKTQGPTYQPNAEKRAKKQRFRARKNSNVLNNRKAKGRKKLSA